MTLWKNLRYWPSLQNTISSLKTTWIIDARIIWAKGPSLNYVTLKLMQEAVDEQLQLLCKLFCNLSFEKKWATDIEIILTPNWITFENSSKHLQEAVDKLFHHTNMFMNRLLNNLELWINVLVTFHHISNTKELLFEINSDFLHLSSGSSWRTIPAKRKEVLH